MMQQSDWAQPWIPTEVLQAMSDEPNVAHIHFDRWVLHGLRPGEWRVDDDCTLRMVPR